MPEPTTPDLFGQEPLPAYQRTSATSRAAAEAIAPKRATLAAKLLEAYERWGPMTDDEASRRTGIGLNSLRPRRVWLVEQGLVVVAGIGTSDAGRKATVWRLADRPSAQERASRAEERVPVRPSGPSADLWAAALRDRPSWMSKRQHEDLMAKAYEAHNGKVKAALEQVARDMERFR